MGTPDDKGNDMGTTNDVIVAVDVGGMTGGAVDAEGGGGGGLSETSGRKGSACGRKRRVGRVDAGRVDAGR